MDCEYDDGCSVTSGEVKEILQGLSAPYRKNGNLQSSPPKASIQERRGYQPDELEQNINSMSSWHFDLGPLKAATKKVEDSQLSTSRNSYLRHTLTSTSSFGDDDDDDSDASMAFISQEMEEASAALMTLTKRNMDQSYSVCGSGVIHSSNHSSNSAPYLPATNADSLHERRAARAERLEKVRKRIAREKEDAEQRKLEAQRRANELFMSEAARRQRLYEWYCRLGRPNRKQMKKHIKDLKATSSSKHKLSEYDIDLLPWNSKGSLVNRSKLERLGVTTSHLGVRATI